MKTTFFRMFFLTTLPILLFACSSDDSPEPEITITTANEFSIAPGVNSRVEVSFTSTYAWQAKVDCDWLVISPTKGEAGNASINVLATEENRTGDVRMATLTITSEEITKDLTIKQEAIDVINLKSNTYTIGEKGGDYDIEYATNLNNVRLQFDEKALPVWIKVLESKGRAMNEGHISIAVVANREF